MDTLYTIHTWTVVEMAASTLLRVYYLEATRFQSPLSPSTYNDGSKLLKFRMRLMIHPCGVRDFARYARRQGEKSASR
jgi:hypothetical protein